MKSYASSRIAPAIAFLATITLDGAVAADAQTHLYWGDTHLHSSWSVDAYSTGNFYADPDTAFRFAKGLPVLHPSTRARVRIDRPLDFLVVADHAEMMQLQVRLGAHDPLLLKTTEGQRLLKILEENPNGVFRQVMQIQKMSDPIPTDLFTDEIRRGSWLAEIEVADRHNEPGRFTTLFGWEWSSAPNGRNLHRVVFTPSPAEVARQFIPYSYYEGQQPEDLWAWLEATSKRTGAEFIAIPHNSNLSDGMMFDLVDRNGRPLTNEYARNRLRWEPVMEVTQVKGTSETHPLLSPGDEFADFEIRNKLLGGQPAAAAEGAYARASLLRGLRLEADIGTNPYRFGMIGSSDSHTGLTSVEEDNFLGKMANDPLPSQRLAQRGVGFAAWEMSASGLAAVWARANTREEIAAAFKRKEVFATSGPRIVLRVFGGFEFPEAAATAADLADVGYRDGVPMGGDLSNAGARAKLKLLIHAAKDPAGANLERVQVIKGWLDDHGDRHERIFDVAWSDDRERQPDGHLLPVKNTVDAAKAAYTNEYGAAQLATVWTDESFDRNQRAFYYVRVLEIPTPRHSAYDAAALNLDAAETRAPVSIQERAYSSPIWYSPATR
ncbi:MAG: DUF3604 domain-containing protein [Gammaproteobacteria bacterium]|nr:DUF3604 domain-containing protein [Gammaproteobacteria bacterium]